MYRSELPSPSGVQHGGGGGSPSSLQGPSMLQSLLCPVWLWCVGTRGVGWQLPAGTVLLLRPGAGRAAQGGVLAPVPC